MRILLLIAVVFCSNCLFAQDKGDSILRRCPVFITDTASSNNFFIEGMPCTLRVYRVKGELTVQVQQRDQFFTLFFHVRNLKNKVYTIDDGSRKRKEVEAAYSFKSGDQVSFISVSKGKLEVSFDKEKDMWRLVVNGMIRNLVERSVTYYKVKSDFYIADER
jgi:hypothetical protein